MRYFIYLFLGIEALVFIATGWKAWDGTLVGLEAAAAHGFQEMAFVAGVLVGLVFLVLGLSGSDIRVRESLKQYEDQERQFFMLNQHKR